MNLHFFGAARTVTGSCFMLENEERILIDIGMFQEVLRAETTETSALTLPKLMHSF